MTVSQRPENFNSFLLYLKLLKNLAKMNLFLYYLAYLNFWSVKASAVLVDECHCLLIIAMIVYETAW